MLLGKRTRSSIQAGETGIDLLRELPDETAQRPAVARHVVAAEHGEPAGAGGAGVPRARARASRGSSAAGPAGEIGPDVGMGEVEIAGRRVVAVALLGDGERDDPRRRRREAGEQGLGLRRREQRLVEDADHARRLLGAVILDHGVEAVLRFAARRGTAALRRLAPLIAQAPGSTASARWVRIAWCARWKAPRPRWTMPTSASSAAAGGLVTPGRDGVQGTAREARPCGMRLPVIMRASITVGEPAGATRASRSRRIPTSAHHQLRSPKQKGGDRRHRACGARESVAWRAVAGGWGGSYMQPTLSATAAPQPACPAGSAPKVPTEILRVTRERLE